MMLVVAAAVMCERIVSAPAKLELRHRGKWLCGGTRLEAEACSLGVERRFGGWFKIQGDVGRVAASRDGETLTKNSRGDLFRLMIGSGKSYYYSLRHESGRNVEARSNDRIALGNQPTRWESPEKLERLGAGERCENKKSLVWFDDNASIPSLDAILAPATMPPVLVLGVGHAGTSSVAHYLLSRGWARPALRPGVKLERSKAEDYEVLVANGKFVRMTGIDKVPVVTTKDARDTASKFLDAGECWVARHAHLWRRQKRGLPVMWKDPQFVWTLHLWRRVVSEEDAILVHVRRDAAKIVLSHKVRGETQARHLNMTVEAAVRARIAWADWQLRNWCGPAVSFNIESLRNVQVKNHHHA